MPPRSQTFHFESKQLRDLANREGIGFRYDWHIEKRMRERDISKLDVQSVIRRGAVIELQPEGRMKVQGRDRDGRDIEVIVVPEEERLVIAVVSVFAKT